MMFGDESWVAIGDNLGSCYAKFDSVNPLWYDVVICTEDVKSIAKTPGIGPKTAARIVLELRDKISKEMLSQDSAIQTGQNTRPAMTQGKTSKNLSEATEALMVLGYDKNSIITALNGIDTENTPVSEIIRLALKKLSR